MFNIKEINDRFFSLFGDVSQKELMKLFDVGQSAVSDWSTGRKRVPWEKLEWTVENKRVTWDWLLTGKRPIAQSAQPASSPEPVESTPHEKNAAIYHASKGLLPEEWRVPVETAAKERFSSNSGFYPGDDSDFLESVVIPKEAMLARVTGDSMSPVILDGQYAIVGPQFLDSQFPPPRSIVVVEVFDDPNAPLKVAEQWEGFYCKRVERRGENCYFTSINPDGDFFTVPRRNCNMRQVIGTIFAGRGTPPDDFRFPAQNVGQASVAINFPTQSDASAAAGAASSPPMIETYRQILTLQKTLVDIGYQTTIHPEAARREWAAIQAALQAADGLHKRLMDVDGDPHSTNPGGMGPKSA